MRDSVIFELLRLLCPIERTVKLLSRTLSPSSPGTTTSTTLFTPPKGRRVMIHVLTIRNEDTTNTVLVSIGDGNTTIYGPIPIPPGESVVIDMDDIPTILDTLVISYNYSITVSGTVQIV